MYIVIFVRTSMHDSTTSCYALERYVILPSKLCIVSTLNGNGVIPACPIQDDYSSLMTWALFSNADGILNCMLMKVTWASFSGAFVCMFKQHGRC